MSSYLRALWPAPAAPADEDDTPPAFPSAASAQRVRTPAASAGLMLPPAAVPPAAARTTLQLPPSTTAPARRREKVVLAPGHSPLDWAALKTSGRDLRGGATELARITRAQLRAHNTRDDAWAAFGGKVYNITPYLAFHPGGEKELLRVAGRDGTRLFGLTHGWVNVEIMLDECMVGFLVPD